jgi:AraC-like DNA-binding protein
MGAEPRGEPGALLNPEAARERIRLSRHHPRTSLQPFVDYIWVVSWDVDEPFEQTVLTQPKVHLAVESGRINVYGLSRRLFTRVLVGRDKAIGVAFRAGGFRPFLGPDERVAALANKVVPAGELWGIDDAAVGRRTLGHADDADMVAAVEDVLESRSPTADPVVDEVAALVDLIESTRSLRKVEELAAEAGIGVRSLQRLFREYVGAPPKWVIQRRRLLDAAEATHAGEPVAWAELAADLGYSDQAHLVRDFAAIVGTPPAAYARALTDASHPAG